MTELAKYLKVDLTDLEPLTYAHLEPGIVLRGTYGAVFRVVSAPQDGIVELERIEYGETDGGAA